MRKRRIIAAALAIAALALPACGKSDGTVTVGGAGTGTPADTGGIGGGMELKSFREKLSGADLSDLTSIGECFAMFDELSAEDKAAVGYADYKKLADAEYAAVNADRLKDIDAHGADVLVSVAKAYYNQSNLTFDGKGKSPQIMYDEYNNRRNLCPSPEEATKQKKLYLDCSSYVGSVYYNTFGSTLLSSGSAVNLTNLEKEWDAKGKETFKDFLHLTEDEVAAIKADPQKLGDTIATIKEMLQPGDVICYRRTTGTGHVILYVGNGKIMHSTGSSNAKTTDHVTDPRTSVEKNGVDEKSFGTINIDDWDRFFTRTVTPKSQNDGRSSTTNSFLFADNVAQIVILRPFNCENGRVRDQKPTAAAIDHYLYEGIDIEKTAKVKRGDDTKTLYYANSLYVGDEVTYTVTAANPTASAMRAISFTEGIPPQFEYLSSSDGSVYFADENTVVLHLSEIAAGSEVTFSYTLKVKSGTAAGTLIKDGETYVNSIAANTLRNQLSAVKLDSEKLKAAIASVTGTKIDDGFAGAKAVYALIDADGFKDMMKLGSSKKVIETVLSSHKLQTGLRYAPRLLYGGYKVGSAEATSSAKDLDFDKVNTRVRRVMKTYIEDGDVIVTYSIHNEKYESYLYCDDCFYGLLSDGTFGKVIKATMSSGGEIQDYLDTLTAYSDYVILRPTMTD